MSQTSQHSSLATTATNNGGRREPVAVIILPSAPAIDSGLAHLLGQHPDRVEVRRPGQQCDVMVFSVVHQHQPRHLPKVLRPLVVVVVDGDTETITMVRKQGATPVSVKADGSQLVDAIEAARAGHLVGAISRAEVNSDPMAPLTPREVQVLNRICAGWSNQEIAAELLIAENSLKTYVRTMYRKIGTRSRTQVVVWGLERGYGMPTDR